MKTVAKHVSHRIHRDGVAHEAMQRGLLNHAKYAAEILPELEKKLLKKVSLSSVAVALGRLQRDVQKNSPPSHPIPVEDFYTQRGLRKIAFSGNAATLSTLLPIAKIAWTKGETFIISQNMKECSVVTKEQSAQALIKKLGDSVLFTQGNLSCITIHIPDESVSTPGIFSSLLKPLMPQRVNVIEILTGLGEISLVVDAKDEEAVTNSLSHE